MIVDFIGIIFSSPSIMGVQVTILVAAAHCDTTAFAECSRFESFLAQRSTGARHDQRPKVTVLDLNFGNLSRNSN